MRAAALPNKQTGFSILEVLVAIVILSIGMLGAVGMQAAAMQSNKEGHYQAVATTLARELAEKMRGNNGVATKTVAAQNPFLMDVTLTDSFTIATPAPNCFTGNCITALELAAWDAADWQARLKTALPTPRVVVCFDSTPFKASGEPDWDCDNLGDTSVVKLGWTRTDTQGQLQSTQSATAPPPLVVVPLSAGSPA